MSKADALLKKATFFERLALYSDRKSFLQSVAQQEAPALSGEQKQLLYQAQNLLQGAGVDASPLGNAVVFNKVDWNAINKTINDSLLLGKLSPLSDEYKQLQSIKGKLNPSSAPSSPSTSGAAGGSGGAPSGAGGHMGGGGGFTPINTEDQKAVFQFAIEEGELGPDPEKQIPDGRLGPETRKALEGVKNYFAKTYPRSYDPKQGGQRMTDQQAIKAAKTPRRQTPTE